MAFCHRGLTVGDVRMVLPNDPNDGLRFPARGDPVRGLPRRSTLPVRGDAD